MLYVTLSLFGAILSFTLQHKTSISVLIIPWVCLILSGETGHHSDKYHERRRRLQLMAVEIVIYADLNKGR